MIKKYSEYINEKLSDKLVGFDENDLKQQLIDCKISIDKYLFICIDNNIKPSKDIIKKMFIDDKIDIDDYLKYCKKYDLDYPTNEEMHFKISKLKPNDMLIYACDYDFLDLVKLSINNEADIRSYNDYCIKSIINKNYYDIIDYFLNYINKSEITSLIIFYSITDNRIDIIKYLIDNNIFINKKYLPLCQTKETKNLLKKYIETYD